MKTCPVCNSTVYEYKGSCQYCRLDLRWVKWRDEGVKVMAIAGVLLLIGIYLSGITNWSLEYNGAYYQSYATYPYAGIGNVMTGIGAISLIAGLASVIYYDLRLRITNQSHNMRPPSAPLPIAAHELEMKHCMHCGQQTSVDAAFCEKCGGRLN